MIDQLACHEFGHIVSQPRTCFWHLDPLHYKNGCMMSEPGQCSATEFVHTADEGEAEGSSEACGDPLPECDNERSAAHGHAANGSGCNSDSARARGSDGQRSRGRGVHKDTGHMEWHSSQSPAVPGAAEWKYPLDTVRTAPAALQCECPRYLAVRVSTVPQPDQLRPLSHACKLDLWTGQRAWQTGCGIKMIRLDTRV